jgi:hypothetical protein
MIERNELKWSLLTKIMDKEHRKIRCCTVSENDNIELNLACLSLCQSFAIEFDPNVVKVPTMNMKMFAQDSDQ